MTARLLAGTKLAAAACLLSACAATAQPSGPNVYYGLLHAHTRFSDGSGTPADAYAMAKAAGLDFFAVTEHNHAKAEQGAGERADGILISKNPALYDSNANLTITVEGQTQQVISVQRAAREAATQDFIALFGQEFSTISSGNHVNVLSFPTVLTDSNGDYRGLFQTLAQHASGGQAGCVVQMNHPDVHEDLFYGGSNQETRDKMFNDYGFDDFGSDFAALVAASDRFVDLVEILSGPAMLTSTRDHLQYGDHHEDDYFYYLAQGYHISPSAGHDNHFPTWGSTTPARMGVLAGEFTQEALLEAMRLNRTFATEDKNLKVVLKVNGSIMGDCLTLGAGSEVNAVLEIEDGDEPSIEYEVTLVTGRVAPQTRQTLLKIVPRDNEADKLNQQGNGTVTFTMSAALGTPEFLYARVKQGDGDRAWTAPIWINHPRAGAVPGTVGTEVFVWTRSASSHVFHHDWCTSANSISAANKMSGATPPADRTLHNCTRPAQPPGH